MLISFFRKPDFIPAVRYVYEQFVAILAWEKIGLHQIILDSSERFAVKLVKVAQPIRLALTGGTVSPPLDITLELLGRETVLQRFKDFFAQVDSTQDDMS